MNSHLTLKTQLLIAALVALVALLLVAGYAALNSRSDMYEQRRVLLQSIVQAATGTVGYYRDLESRGKLTREQAQAQAREALRGVRYQEREYFFIRDLQGTIILYPAKPEREGTSGLNEVDTRGKAYTVEFIELAKRGGGFVEYYFPRPGESQPVRKISYVHPVEGWGWVVGTGMYVDDLETRFWKETRITLLGLLVCAGLVFGVIMLIGRNIVRQVGGEPRQAVVVMQKVAAGDLTVSVVAPSQGSLLEALNAVISNLRQMLEHVAGHAASLSSASTEISATSSNVADAAQGQADATAGMAAAIEQMTVSVTHISDNAKDSEDNASAAVQLAAEGENRVADAVGEMSQIAASVQDTAGKLRALTARTAQVGSIAQVIKEIAAQTNLLALNAAIESARAGEHGRGFSVVADEVRKLSERTSQATIEIEQMIGGIQVDTESAVKAMDATVPQVESGQTLAQQAAASLQQIKSGATQSLDRVSELASATREQSAASTSIAQQVEQIARMVEQTSASMKETAVAADALQRIASELDGLVSKFRV